MRQMRQMRQMRRIPNVFKRYVKPFWMTLLWHQNKWHKHSVLVHTVKVVWYVVKVGRFDLIPAAILHDIAKPLTAYFDKEDIKGGYKDYSFTNHEELSYHIIKNWPISDFTKNMVRYHYHIRGMNKARKKKNWGKLNRYRRGWNKLPDAFKKDLAVFLVADDKAKTKGWK